MIKIRRMTDADYALVNHLVDEKSTGRIWLMHRSSDSEIWIALILPNGFIIENGDAEQEINALANPDQSPTPQPKVTP